jgi:hypothetical protein
MLALQAKTAATSTITVTYVNNVSEDWPQEAKDAFEFAKGIWENALTSTQEIRVEANWVKYGCTAPIGVVLGSAGPNNLHRDFTGAPLTGTWYADALADALSGSDQSGPTEFDVISNFNADCDGGAATLVQWYFGTDGNTPTGEIDFVSVVLHELGHGLGFFGAGNVSGSAGTVLNDGFPIAYDQFTEDGTGTALLTYTDGSADLADAIQGQAGGVFFDGTATTAANGNAPAPLYAPEQFEGGSSYSHLDSSFDADPLNNLMTPTLTTGVSQHILGSITCSLFADIGWTVDAGACTPALSVELADFRAVADGDAVHLRWETLSEVDNSGFEVQRRVAHDGFRTAGFVAGAGESATRRTYSFRVDNLEPGVHSFRLRQVDLDGGATVSDAVEVLVPILGGVVLTNAYPNPFNPTTTFSVTVSRSQTVRVEVYDALGRMVDRVFDGLLESGVAKRLDFDATGLPSGLYVYRATGEDFSVARQVLALR